MGGRLILAATLKEQMCSSFTSNKHFVNLETLLLKTPENQSVPSHAGQQSEGNTLVSWS